LGTGATRNTGGQSVTNPYSTGGFISTVGTTTETLSTLAPGYFGFFDTNYQSINPASPGASVLTACKPLFLCSSSLLTNDKIGPFAGGYGFGVRSTLLGYFMKLDAAWPMKGVFKGKPIYYFSLGFDF
jgi:hypothetical protein